LLIRPIYRRSDPLYSLLLTFGLALMIEDLTRTIWGPQGLPLEVPEYSILRGCETTTTFSGPASLKAAGTGALLRLERISPHSGPLKAVDGVSFEVAPGELHAVIGPNGAGTTQ